MNPAPTTNEEPTPDGTLSAYAVPVSFQDRRSAPPTRTGPSPTNSGVAKKDATPRNQDYLPVFKDQTRTVMPSSPSASSIPTVDATPVEDSKVEVDTPNKLDDIGETPNRRRGIDP